MDLLRVFTVFFFVILHLSNAKFIKDKLRTTTENWVFLTRFCFLSDEGQIEFKIVYPEKYSVQSILLYYDEASQWAAVYRNESKNCHQKKVILKPTNNQVIDLSERGSWSGCSLHNGSYHCATARKFRSSRERWWFVALCNCESKEDCSQKESVLVRDNNQIIPLYRQGDPKYYWSVYTTYDGCVPKIEPGDPLNRTYYHCRFKMTFKSVRERWWFVAVDNCNSTRGLSLDYEVTMTNSERGNRFFYHFSADEFYILQVDIAFLLAQFIIFCLSCYMANILVSRQLFHTTYKMYMTALVFENLHLLVMCSAYGAYANDGIERRGVLYFGRVFESVSVLAFVLMLILMAKGYTITRGRLSQSGAIKIAVFMTAYVIVYAILFIYEAFFFDPGYVLYTYESVPGYGLIGLRLVGWIWFCYAIFFTLKHYPEKGAFYYPFFVFYTIWFFAWPIMAVVAMTTMKPHWREKVVNGVIDLFAFCGFIFFAVLTRPAAANKNFPYHVRTSQIGVMGDQPTQNGTATGLAAIPYSGESSGPNFTDLFVVTGLKQPTSQPPGPATGYASQQDVQPNSHTGYPVNIDAFPHHKPGEHTLDHFITEPTDEQSIS